MKKALLLLSFFVITVASFAQHASQRLFLSPNTQNVDAKTNTFVSKWGKSVDYQWSQNAWINNTISYYTYDVNANLSNVLLLNASTLDTISIEDYQYNSNKQQTVKATYRKNNVNNNWEIQAVDSSFYDGQFRRVKFVSRSLNFGATISGSQKINTYDALGNQTSDINYYFDYPKNKWQISFGYRYNFTYTANNFLKTSRSERYVPQSKRFAIEESDSFIVNNIGVPVNAFINYYDTSGNLTLKHRADSIGFSGFVSPIFSGFGSQILLPSTRLIYYKLQIEFGSLWIDDARISLSFGNNGKKNNIIRNQNNFFMAATSKNH